MFSPDGWDWLLQKTIVLLRPAAHGGFHAPLNRLAVPIVKAAWRIWVDKAVSQLHRYYQRQVAVSHTSMGWRCEVLMTHRVQELPPQMGLKTMPRNSSSKAKVGSWWVAMQKKDNTKNCQKWETLQGFCVKSEGGEGLLVSLYRCCYILQEIFCLKNCVIHVCALSQLYQKTEQTKPIQASYM